jgi:hypothetical protein
LLCHLITDLAEKEQTWKSSCGISGWTCLASCQLSSNSTAQKFTIWLGLFQNHFPSQTMKYFGQ